MDQSTELIVRLVEQHSATTLTAINAVKESVDALVIRVGLQNGRITKAEEKIQRSVIVINRLKLIVGAAVGIGGMALTAFFHAIF